VDWFCRLCVFFGDSQPQNSWFDGTNSQIDSMHKRYLVLDASIGADKSAVVVGAEMVGTEEPNFEMQAAAIILQTPKPDLVVVELGGNDLCSRDCIEPSRCVDPVTPVYDDETWETALRAGLDVLVGPGGLDEGATIYLLGVPRVQDLRAAGEAKQGAPGIDCEDFWLDFDVCTIGTIEGEWNGESEAERNLGLSERQRRYNEILRDTALLYTTSTGPGELNERGIEVVADYVNESTPSVGTTAFGAEEINGGDCFHPSIAGQDLLSEVAWTGNPRP
jgi:hypothetical protein